MDFLNLMIDIDLWDKTKYFCLIKQVLLQLRGCIDRPITEVLK